jgi:hypothetical protein
MSTIKEIEYVVLLYQARYRYRQCAAGRCRFV